MPKQPPLCPECSEPLETYTIEITRATARTFCAWNAEAEEYEEETGDLDDLESYCVCDLCMSTIPYPEV
jgi:hypothetical protein